MVFPSGVYSFVVTRTLILLERFRGMFLPWMKKIVHGVGHPTAVLEVDKSGEFTIRLNWKDGMSLTRKVTRQDIFGKSYEGQEITWVVEKRPCDLAKEIISETLHKRGVL